MLENIKNIIKTHIEEENLIKIQGKFKNHSSIKNTIWKPFYKKEILHWQLVETHKTKDLTYSFIWEEGMQKIMQDIENRFSSCMIFTESGNYQLIYNKKNKIQIKKHKSDKTQSANWSHDKNKNYILRNNALYLQELGLVDKKGEITKSGRDKYKQIHHIIHLLEKIFDRPEKRWNIADLGAGKGYLSFGIYDYLQSKGKDVNIRAIEMRKKLVNNGNALAKKVGFEDLQFEANKIEDVSLNNCNMLLALHACDTATDDAIIKGIKANVKYIILAPCCHKYLRQHWDIRKADKFHDFYLQHNIYQERSAELLTDSIRGLILSYYGYQVRIIDFISTEHTPKNVLIIAERKSEKAIVSMDKWDKLEKIKKSYGIKNYYLEDKLA